MPLGDAEARASVSPLPAPAYASLRIDQDDSGDDVFFPDEEDVTACGEPDTISNRVRECDDTAGVGRPAERPAPAPEDVRADGRAGWLTLAAMMGALAISGAAYWLTTRLAPYASGPARGQDDDEGASTGAQ
ncbi:hypothetical protein FAF44_01225 [Nonomuraea sp. MG754425]|uniref:hypothetical protein n=1 Tax=Nonomuraea sp. MG754425 TaxID=2570319 RepID=UPI001F408207|nr:hypothetical protein [Nonomuraea sp. MG754425]MCF6467034.1 hypothetical protein [Nonomuraea sp. MG754425]